MKHDNLLALFLVTIVSVAPVKADSFSEIPISSMKDSVSMQIPDDILVKMPTNELLQSCVTFPLVVECIILQISEILGRIGMRLMSVGRPW